MACACKYLPSERHFKWHPKITGPLPKGEQFTFRKWITHLWNQTNTQAAQFQQTLKCKRQLSYLKRPKSYSRRDGEGRVCQTQGGWFSLWGEHHDGSFRLVVGGCQGTPPSAWREMPPGPALFPFAKHKHSEENLWKGLRVFS